MPAKTILLVEDDIDAQAVIRWTLESRGYVCISATSASEATMQVEANGEEIACVVMDFFLPDSDGMVLGVQLIQKLGNRKVPLVGVTAFYTPELRAKSLAAGFDACLAKPLAMNEFIATLGTLIS